MNITVKCGRCGYKVRALKDEHDPPNAALVETAFCTKCEQPGDGRMSEYDSEGDLTFFDSEGNEIVEVKG